MSIRHFEDLPLDDILHFLENHRTYKATEKVDGSQLLFGIDEHGFYTSRETKGGKRIYNLSEYDLDFHNTYRRMAHAALQSSISLLIDAGMKVGDQVEIEVLYGSLPNVIEYSESTNYIIFLRTTSGSIDIDCLQSSFDKHTVSVSMLVPTTSDGISIVDVNRICDWRFVRVPSWEYDEHDLDSILKDRLGYYSEFLNRKVHELGISYRQLLSIHLGKISDYKIDKESISALRDLVRLYDSAHRLSIKNDLLNSIIRNRPSNLGPSHGFVEGVIFTRADGKMFKLVDKDLFREVQKFYWMVRNNKELVADNLTIPALDLILDKYIKAKDEYTLVVPYSSRVFKYTDSVHQRTLETFASRRRQLA